MRFNHTNDDRKEVVKRLLTYTMKGHKQFLYLLKVAAELLVCKCCVASGSSAAPAFMVLITCYC